MNCLRKQQQGRTVRSLFYAFHSHFASFCILCPLMKRRHSTQIPAHQIPHLNPTQNPQATAQWEKLKRSTNLFAEGTRTYWVLEKAFITLALQTIESKPTSKSKTIRKDTVTGIRHWPHTPFCGCFTNAPITRSLGKDLANSLTNHQPTTHPWKYKKQARTSTSGRMETAHDAQGMGEAGT